MPPPTPLPTPSSAGSGAFHSTWAPRTILIAVALYDLFSTHLLLVPVPTWVACLLATASLSVTSRAGRRESPWYGVIALILVSAFILTFVWYGVGIILMFYGIDWPLMLWARVIGAFDVFHVIRNAGQ